MRELCPQEMAGPLGGERSARKRGQKMGMRNNHTGEGHGPENFAGPFRTLAWTCETRPVDGR